MKKIFYTITVCLITAGAFAQVTLTKDNNGYAVGDVYNLYSTNLSDTGAAGANVSWNFASISSSASPTQIANVSAPSGAAANDFPSANRMMSIMQSGQTISQFFAVSDAGISNYGYDLGAAGKVVLSDPEDLMHYPLTIGNSYTDPWSGVFISAGSTFNRSGTTTVSVTGYGTLITPLGMYSDVLKIHVSQNYADSFQGMQVYAYQTSIYEWMMPGYHSVIASYTTSSFSQPLSYLSNPVTTGVGNIIDLSELINIYPNPSSDRIFIKNTGKVKLQRIILTDLKGVILESWENDAAAGLTSISLINRPSGNYILNIVTDKGIRAGEVITKR